MDERPAALMLSPEPPFPAVGGGALRTASLAEYLGRRYQLDAILFREPGQAEPVFPPGLIRRLSIIPLSHHARSTGARAARNLSRLLRGVPPLVDRFSRHDTRIADLLRDRRYRAAVIEHSWCAPYLDVIAPHAERVVLDLHNIESELHARCAESEGPAAALAHRRFQAVSLAFERRWFPRFSLVLVPSGAGAERARSISTGAKVAVYPNALPAVPLVVKQREEAIIFTGNLEYHPNVTAIRWFYREVWPAICRARPQLVWRVAGRNPDQVLKIVNDPRVRVEGPFEDAIDEIARAQIAVVPLLAGSGTRFKILEAWAAATPVVATSIGAEGLPARDGDNLLLADSPGDFAGAVDRLLANPDLHARLAAAGRKEYETGFNWEVCWNLLARLGI